MGICVKMSSVHCSRVYNKDLIINNYFTDVTVSVSKTDDHTHYTMRKIFNANSL